MGPELSIEAAVKVDLRWTGPLGNIKDWRLEYEARMKGAMSLACESREDVIITLKVAGYTMETLSEFEG